MQQTMRRSAAPINLVLIDLRNPLDVDSVAA